MPAADEPRTVALVCPTTWDAVQLRGLRSKWPRYSILPYGGDAEHALEDFDAEAFIAQAIEDLGSRGVDGVTSSSDYPGCLVASFISRELGLPGPSPRSLLLCSHKYYSRIAQRDSVPEVTPRFALVDPRQVGQTVGLPFPLFVKPVKSWFSQHARRVESMDELRTFVQSPRVRAHLDVFVRPFNDLLRLDGGFGIDGSYLLAEEVLVGHQVTLEGFVHAGRAVIIGVVDSIMYDGTISFERFEYPSSLGSELSERMRVVVERMLGHIGFDTGVFNVELRYDPATDDVRIVEVNPRMCAQWADLMEEVKGTNTYEVLLALAVGDDPPATDRPGANTCGTSFVLRHFNDAIVIDAPDEGRLEVLRRQSPASVISTFYASGDRLSHDEFQSDGPSYRYAVINISGGDGEALKREFDGIHASLGFKFRDSADPPADALPAPAPSTPETEAPP